MLHKGKLHCIRNTVSELELLAKLIQCEAGGEGDVGMRAVATVIVNRLRAIQGEFSRQQSLSDVVFAPRQFECTTHPTQNVWLMSPSAIHYDIARWALEGNKLGAVGDALWFYNPLGAPCRAQFPNSNGTFSVRIGEHCFYRPTPSYAST